MVEMSRKYRFCDDHFLQFLANRFISVSNLTKKYDALLYLIWIEHCCLLFFLFLLIYSLEDATWVSEKSPYIIFVSSIILLRCIPYSNCIHIYSLDVAI